MVSQFDVELLAEVAGMSPEERGIDLFFAVAPADVFGGWKNPGDDRQLFGPSTLPKGELKDLLRCVMKSSNDLLVLFEERIIPSGKGDQGSIPVFPPVHLAAVPRTPLSESNDLSRNESFRVFGKRDSLHPNHPFREQICFGW